MSVLAWIICASVLGSILSIAAAAVFALNARASWIPMLVSYAIGAMLGAVFLEILPHAVELTKNFQHVAATILFGILVFFVLEKLVLWRHCHGEECEAHGTRHEPVDHGRSGMLIMLGDTFHNFVDGILIAAAFMADIQLGIVTSLAIIAHEIPQEVGDFAILLHSGYTKRQALLFNLLTSSATLLGGIMAFYALQGISSQIPLVLGIAAASMIYVAVADLIPGLHKRPELSATLEQITLIVLGVGSIWLTETLLGGWV
ncbi:MAG: ZIP family metal transporter [Burkholderiales bacterium]